MNQAIIPNFLIYSTKSTFGSTFGLEIASGPIDRGCSFLTFRHVILYYYTPFITYSVVTVLEQSFMATSSLPAVLFLLNTNKPRIDG